MTKGKMLNMYMGIFAPLENKIDNLEFLFIH